MDQDLLAYYNSELAYLRELGAEFATRFPKVAGRLQLDANDCADPHVERLLEGFAFLTARVRQKLDDEFPEVTQAFLEVLYPHALRPVPSLSIAQFVPGPDPAKLTQGFTVPAGARLQSAPAGGGQTCRFRTAYPVTLWPISLAAARLVPERVAVPEKPPSALAMIELTLKLDGGLTFDQLPLDRLRFYLDGDRTNVNALYELLFNHVVQVAFQAQTPNAATPGRERFSLPPGAIQPVGFGPDEGLFPLDARSFPGHRLLQEYFAFPEKFLFFDLAELQKLGTRFKTSQLLVQIFLDRSPRARVTADLETFRLGCSPIVNLFSQLAEPIILDQSRFEYRVIPDVNRPLATEVYSVEQVSSSNSLLAESRQFEPFYAMRHADRTGADGSAHWLAARRPSLRQGDPGTEVYLSFVDAQFNPARPASEILSVRTLCTNRDLPPRLPFGGDQGDFQLESPGPISRVRCLRKPTPALRPHLARAAHWGLISHLALNHLSLASTTQGLDSLREILRLHEWAESSANRQQIEGLIGLESRRVAGRSESAHGRAICHGVEIELEFDESHFAGSGMFLFASVLERFLGMYTTINGFSRLVARSRQREGVVKRWPARAGYRTLL